MEQYLRDKDFLTELCSQREREVFARVTALNLDDLPLEQIEGKVTNGSINIDGASAVRRTCSLSMVTESLDINEYYWGLKTKIKIEIGLKNNLKKYQNHTIIWFPMGIYLISTFSLSQSTTGITINIGGKDKMCILNGEMGGILMAPTDFGKMETYDEAGNRTVTKIPVKQIISDMIHQYGNEPYSKIFIEDIEDFGLNLQNWRGADPCYFYLQSLEAGGRTPIQISLNPDDLVLIKEDDQTMAATLRQLENVDQQKYFAGGGNSLTNELATVPVYYYKGPLDQQPHVNSEGNIVASTDENENWMANWSDSAAFVKKVDYGDTVGYTITELVYPEDLIANAGETITSVLDKIKAMLGDFEYFYDIDGNFIFRKQKAYKETYSAQNIFDLETNKTITDGENTYDNSMYLIGATDDSIDFKFDNLELITNISNNPAIGNVKNDFTVWGNRKGANGAQIPIHMRYAIDKKPEEYHSIEITSSRADMLLRCYPELFPMQEGEIGTMAVSRLMATHRAGDYYYRMPERMKKQVVAYREMYLKPYFEFFKKSLPSNQKIKLENFINQKEVENISLDGTNTITLYTEADCEEFEEALLDLTSSIKIFSNNIYHEDDNGTRVFDSAYSLITHLRQMDEYITKTHIYAFRRPRGGEKHSQAFNDMIEGLGKFAQSYLDVRDNLYDWRELIYQMAKDYRSFNQIGEFGAWLEEANPYTCIAGKTGYEQYYIDMEGFWRQIYDKSWHDVKWNDDLKQGRIYRLRNMSDNPEDGDILQYNTKSLTTDAKQINEIIENGETKQSLGIKTVNGKTISAQVPNIDIYTLGNENGKDHYTKIGKLYDIIENDYKIMEPIIQRYLIDEWQETHPEATWRLFGLTKNGSNFLEQNTLYLQDPHAQKRDEVTGKFSTASNLEDQLYTNLRPYYHKGEYNDSKSSLGELTYLSNSKEPLWTGAGSNAETFYKALIDADAEPVDYLRAFRVVNGLVQSADGEKEKITDNLKKLGKIWLPSEDNDTALIQMGLIAAILIQENAVGVHSISGFKTLIKKYFIKPLAEYVYGRRIMNNDKENFLQEGFSFSQALADAASNCFGIGLTAFKEELSKDKKTSTSDSVAFLASQFEEYNSLLSFFKLISLLGNREGDNILNIEDFKWFIRFLIEDGIDESKIASQFKKYYSQWIDYGATNLPSLGTFLKEFYFRVTNDNSFEVILGLTDIGKRTLFSNFDESQKEELYSLAFTDEEKNVMSWSTLSDDEKRDKFFQELTDLEIDRLFWQVSTDNQKAAEHWVDIHNLAFFSIILGEIFSSAMSDTYNQYKETVTTISLVCNNFLTILKRIGLYPFDINVLTSNSLKDSLEEIVYQYIVSYFDLDGDGLFSILDIQEAIKIAVEDPSLSSATAVLKEKLSFDDEYSMNFSKVRFLYVLFCACYAHYLAILREKLPTGDPARGDDDQPLGAIMPQLWVLTITPYAIEATKKNGKSSSPYYVKTRLFEWTGNSAYWSQVKSLFGSGQIFQIICEPADAKPRENSDEKSEHVMNTSSKIMAAYIDPSKLSKRYPGKTISAYEYYLASELTESSSKGDVNGDGKVTAKDARLAAQYAGNLRLKDLGVAKNEMELARKAKEEEG